MARPAYSSSVPIRRREIQMGIVSKTAERILERLRWQVLLWLLQLGPSGESSGGKERPRTVLIQVPVEGDSGGFWYRSREFRAISFSELVRALGEIERGDKEKDSLSGATSTWLLRQAIEEYLEYGDLSPFKWLKPIEVQVGDVKKIVAWCGQFTASGYRAHIEALDSLRGAHLHLNIESGLTG